MKKSFIFSYIDAVEEYPYHSIPNGEHFCELLYFCLHDPEQLNRSFVWDTFSTLWNAQNEHLKISWGNFDLVHRGRDWRLSPNLKEVFETLLMDKEEPFNIKTLL